MYSIRLPFGRCTRNPLISSLLGYLLNDMQYTYTQDSIWKKGGLGINNR